MLSRGLFLVFVLLLSGQAEAQPAQPAVLHESWSEAEQEVWTQVQAYSAASERRDLDAYLDFFHPGFIGWHNGRTAPDDLAERRKGLAWYFSNTTTEAYALEPLAIQVFGEIAVVRYKIRQRVQQQGPQAGPSVSHWTDILVKENGRWLLAGDHGGSVPPAWDADSRRPVLRVEALKIRVPDLEAAVRYYRDVLGFDVQTDTRFPGSVVLPGANVPLVLEEARDIAAAGVFDKARPKLTFEAYDLAATMAHMKQAGVIFHTDPPEPYGYNQDGQPLGLATAFRDPFGYDFTLVEQQLARGEAFEGVRAYNTGYYVSDVEPARAFYSDLLGFVVRSETYLPRSLPLGHADGSFAFMLHRVEGADPIEEGAVDIRPLALVFATDDLAAVQHMLKQKGVTLLHEQPQNGLRGSYVAFKDPFGIVSEVVERLPGQ